MSLKDRIKKLEVVRGKKQILLVILKSDGSISAGGHGDNERYNDAAAFFAEGRFRRRDIHVLGECCFYPAHGPEGPLTDDDCMAFGFREAVRRWQNGEPIPPMRIVPRQHQEEIKDDDIEAVAAHVQSMSVCDSIRTRDAFLAGVRKHR